MAERMANLSGWAFMKRRGRLVRTLTDMDGDKWQEWQDRISGLHFYFCDVLSKYKFELPDLPPPPREQLDKELQLHVGEKVLHLFKGTRKPALSTVTSIREDDETHEIMYDVESAADDGAYVARWVKRRALQKAPKTAEEMELEEKETAWRKELRAAKAKRERQAAERQAQEYEKERQTRRGPIGSLLRRRYKDRDVDVEGRRQKRAEKEAELRIEEERQAAERAATVSQLLKAASTSSQTPEEVLKAAKYTLSRGSQDGAIEMPSATGTEQSLVPTVNWGRSQIEAERAAREDEKALRAQEVEEELVVKEGKMTSPRTLNRRRVVRMLHMCMIRQDDGYVVCEWGCRCWVKLGHDKFFHETELCIKRVLPCELGCGLRMKEEEWLAPAAEKPEMPRQQYHEEEECRRRLLPCKRRCGEWVPFEEMDRHLRVLCIKHPVPALQCRLGCGETFEGGLHRLLQSEEERLEHEHELCDFRLMPCPWDGCDELVRASCRKEHREEHIIRTGVILFTRPGTFEYDVPDSCHLIKVQVWGAGGGGGHMIDGPAGPGGGAAFVEALVKTMPGEQLHVVVGAGGAAGVPGYVVDVPAGKDPFTGKQVFEVQEVPGVAEGGWPGGGVGHGGNAVWAAGGGGGCSMISVGQPGGSKETLIVAGGGGGGGSRAGVPGGGEDGELPGTMVDKRNGRMGRADVGGEGGFSGDVLGCSFPPQKGRSFQGGAGAQFGGGGGAGLWGGGGGGTTPGIVGGGGGGSSFVARARMQDCVVLQGEGKQPGGRSRHVPPATGQDEFDYVGGVAGEGGHADRQEVRDGRSGAVRLMLPNFFAALDKQQ
ncbi:unnamed protein product [Chrysoparadoxa australica]